MSEKPTKRGPSWVRYAGIGVDFAAAVGGFALIGYLIDRHWGFYPKATLAGVVLGLIGGMYNLVRSSLAAFKEVPAPEKKSDDQSP